MSRVPASMRAIEIAQPGGPEQLVPVMRPAPHPGAGEVLIRVEAAGVNRPDVLQRQGLYPPPEGASDLPGLEVAGEVLARGAGVDWPREGERVAALVAGGGYAELCVAPAVQCLPVPRGLGAVEAAALPECVFTVWANVFERGGLRAGERLLVHGGTSGIGVFAVQLARAKGAEVWATAGTPEKCAACEALGARRAIDHRREDFEQVLRAEAGGIDVVLDMVGGDYVPKNLAVLRAGGRHVSIAFLRGRSVEVDLFTVMRKGLVLTGSTLRARSVAEKGALAATIRREVWPLIEAGQVRAVIDSTFPLEAAADAHRRMEGGAHVGKIVLTLGGGVAGPVEV